MIQRIQTIFLALAAILSGLLHTFPFAKAPVTEATLFADGVFNVTDHIGLIAFFTLSLVTALVAIFLFKDRAKQVLLTRISLILNILGAIFGIFLFMTEASSIGNQTPSDGLGVYIPVLVIIFLILALRFIKKDEKLVKSMDRLR